MKIDYKWMALSVTTIGLFISLLDTTIVVIALPTILQDLHADITVGIWIITGFTLMVPVLLVILGRISDIYGRVKLYNLGFAVFTLGSLLCGLSQTGEQLIIFRFVQGVGAALLVANNTAIVTDAFPKKELGLGLGINMMAMNLGSIAGFTLGGVMINYFGWRSIFLINIPIGIFGTIWGYLRLKENGVRPAGQKFDWAGAILYGLGLTIILIGLTIGNPTSGHNLAIVAAGIVIFVAVILVELRQKYPTLDLTLFKIRLFAAGNLASFLNSLSFCCTPFLMSLYLQLVLGYSPMKAGLYLIPMQIVVLVLGPISGSLSDKFGARALSALGSLLNAAALIWVYLLGANSTYGIILALLLFGVARSLFMSPNSAMVMSSVPAQKRGVANGIRATLNQTGNVLSVPVCLMLMSLVMPWDQLSQIVSNSQLKNAFEIPVFVKGIDQSCLVLGILSLLAVIPSLQKGQVEKVPAKG